ncbi:hypothetical protein [Solitalea canadensis]|uniref:Uncharacterized protein n=1 Tax=Solitalea canadensis (strain ATCC 29591 / DSM 3403 / JCM 21819 / LMG 8368 / NBRC 15130 / NCIMB 12057 / USAM 9D) TaxID=929556 RepID=H8KPT4_SOLCM|nr:hypothetical protein [Solitalea canadensis]AFD05982.1 hypothetical protein Solca_0867 [Solitalea canadensis DSM 3403]
MKITIEEYTTLMEVLLEALKDTERAVKYNQNPEDKDRLEQHLMNKDHLLSLIKKSKQLEIQ